MSAATPPPMMPNYPPGMPPPPEPPAANPVSKFFLGLLAGVAASIMVWGIIYSAREAMLQRLWVWVFGLLLVKVAVSVPLLARRALRMVGAGLLASLAIGFLLFTGGLIAGMADLFPRSTSANGAAPTTSTTQSSSGCSTNRV